MPNVTNVVTLGQFKTTNNLTSLDVVLSKSQKRYVVVNGTVIMMAPDTDTKTPMFVVSMLDKDTGETWQFITSTEPKALNVIETI